jgi:hypothetical protein
VLFRSDSLNDAELIKVKSLNDFSNTFKLIKQNIIKYGIVPIIHIEAHGNQEYLILSHEQLKWSALYDMLIEINLLLKNWLILILAMCYGGWITKCLNPSKRSPFRYLLSSPNKVYDKELLNGFVEFYNTFFFSEQKQYSLNNLNEFISSKKSKFVLLDMEERFDYFVNIDNDPKILRKKIALFKQQESKRNPIFSYLPEPDQNAIANEFVRKFKNDILAKKDYFMMKDLL